MYKITDIVEANSKYIINKEDVQINPQDDYEQAMADFYHKFFDNYNKNSQCTDLNSYLQYLDFNYITNDNKLSNAFNNSMLCVMDSMYNKSLKLPFYRLMNVKNNMYDITGTNGGNFGNIYVMDVENKPFLFIKSDKPDMEKNINSYHEAFVAIIALNNLKKYVPNFMQTYGIFNCNYILTEKITIKNLTKNRLVNSFCSNVTPQKIYVISEFINDAEKINKLWNKFSLLDTLLIFIQIHNAFKVAYDFYKFRHNDFHPGNLLIQYFSNGIYQPIYLDSGLVYIKTYYVPRIIDYGKSAIRYGNIDFFIDKYSKNIANSFSAMDMLTVMIRDVCYNKQVKQKYTEQLTRDNLIPEKEKLFYLYEKMKNISSPTTPENINNEFLKHWINILSEYDVNKEYLHKIFNPPSGCIVINPPKNFTSDDLLYDNFFTDKLSVDIDLPTFVMIRESYIKEVSSPSNIELWKKFANKIKILLQDYDIQSAIAKSQKLISQYQGTLKNKIILQPDLESYDGTFDYLNMLNTVIFERNLYALHLSSIVYCKINIKNVNLQYIDINNLIPSYQNYYRETTNIIKSNKDNINDEYYENELGLYWNIQKAL